MAKNVVQVFKLRTNWTRLMWVPPKVEPARPVFGCEQRLSRPVCSQHIKSSFRATCSKVHSRQNTINLPLTNGLGWVNRVEDRLIESSLNKDLLHTSHVCRIVGEVAILVLNLCRDYGSTIADLILSHLLTKALHPSLSRDKECRIVCAQRLRHTKIFQQPCRKSTKLPLRTRVRPGS